MYVSISTLVLSVACIGGMQPLDLVLTFLIGVVNFLKCVYGHPPSLVSLVGVVVVSSKGPHVNCLCVTLLTTS